MSTVAQLEEVKSPWSGGKSPFSVEYGKLMMWFFLLSDVFTFSALLIFYGAMRFKSHSWPDPDVVFRSVPGVHGEYPLVFVGIMTFILIFSSVTMVLAVEAGHRNSKSEVVKWLVLTVLGGLTFLGCQAWEWGHLIHEGMSLHHNPFINADGSAGAVQFGQLFFVITGFHGFHVFTGVVINIVILINAMFGTYERRGHYLMVEKVGLYWHFVDLVWVFVFTLFYLV